MSTQDEGRSGRLWRLAQQYVLLQPFVNNNVGGCWYLGSVAIITANRRTSGNAARAVPVGVGGGRVAKVRGKLSVKFVLGAYYNMPRPQYRSI